MAVQDRSGRTGRRRYQRFAALTLAAVVSGCSGIARTEPVVPDLSAEIPTTGFDDAVHHWKNRYGTSYARYETTQVAEIADNILLMQRDHGGWIENQDPLRILSAEDRERYLSEKADARASFDNRNVYTQVAYLMGAYERTGEAKYKAGALAGLNFLLDHQMETCGGWPHTVPTSQRFHPLLTIADEVLSGPLMLLRPMAAGEWPYGSLDAEVKARAEAALKRGDACVLRLQVRQGERLAGWAGQYDPVSLEPAMGRTFELPAMAVQETVEILRYLMTIESPSDEVIASIEGGVQWLRDVALEGVRLEDVELPEPVRFIYHSASHDRRLVEAVDAPPLWARFYDVIDNTVVLANRDSQRVDRYEQIDIERRTGYQWYGDWPETLLSNEYPAWKAGLN